MRFPTLLPVLAGVALLAAACSKNDEYRSSSAAVDPLNSLRRGELSAVETYRQAIAKEGSAAADLATIRSDHEDAAERLRQRIVALGGEADSTSGAWGDFAKAIEGTAKIFGNSAAMSALKTGEKHGIDSYESALTNSKVDSDSKDLIRASLLPRQRSHVDTLERLISNKPATDTANR